MSPENWKFRITDILNSIKAIIDYTSGIGFEEFVSDRKTVDAVIRNLIVIGEAAARVPENECESHPEIPWILHSKINPKSAIQNSVSDLRPPPSDI